MELIVENNCLILLKEGYFRTEYYSASLGLSVMAPAKVCRLMIFVGETERWPRHELPVVETEQLSRENRFDK